MPRKLTTTEMIKKYIRENRSDIENKLRKNKYEKLEEKYNLEQKIKSIIPCNDCLVRAACADRFKTDIFTITINCDYLKTFNEALGYVIRRRTTYKDSSDYERRIFQYVKKKVAEGGIILY